MIRSWQPESRGEAIQKCALTSLKIRILKKKENKDIDNMVKWWIISCYSRFFYS